ncbi:MAG: CHAT domain-containing protein [Vicinamibacterales bacterium]
MPDWSAFRAGIVSGTRPAELADACACAWRWLDRTDDARRQEVEATVRSAIQARWVLEALPLLRRRLWRDAGIDPDDTAALQRLLDEAGAGRAGDASLRVLRRFDAAVTIGRLVAERFPSLPPSPGAADRAALLEHVPPLSEAIQGTGTGLASAASLDRLREAIGRFEPIGAQFVDDARREHAWWLGLAWWAIGRGALESMRYAEAVDAFERSASFYDTADEATSAADCRKERRAIEVKLAGDFDAAAEPAARTLLEAGDPWRTASALTTLLREVGRSGDRFEAHRLGDKAARALEAAGYPDPEAAFHPAIAQWIASAAHAHTGTALFARLCEAAERWAAILGARASARIERDAAASERAERALRGLAALPATLHAQAEQARRTAMERLAVWLPLPQPDGFDDPALPIPLDDPVQASAQLDASLHALRVACNEAPDARLLERAVALRRDADALGSRVHAARARLEHAYVLLALGRESEVPEVADAAIAVLVAGHAPHLGAFTTGYEREVYLTAIDYKARALAAAKDAAGIIALCEPVIRDLESERRRVSAPYQQSAFLATRAGLYEVVAAAAYRTGREDLLLAIPDLLKARTTLRSLLAPTSSTGTAAETEADLRRVGDALRQATPGSDEEAALRDRRRWLSTLTAGGRGRQSAEPPELSLPALQQSLAADEAVVSWFWAAGNTLLAHAVTRGASRCIAIELDASRTDQIRDCIACITALSGPSPRYGRLIAQLESLVASLGPVLFPDALRDLVAEKTRLALSPHRALHLFPFHAVPWVEGESACRLIERCSIRYVPNLTSLLIEWPGPTTGDVLAVGVGRFDDPAVPPIPGAEAEAAAVAAIHGARAALRLAPSRAEFAAAVQGRHRCLHIATHGSSVLGDDALDDPLEACLYLRDGGLSAWDLIDLRVHAELVVLGACHSGQRAIAGRGLTSLPGDDILGLQSVLFDAGAGAILGALWPVDDDTARTVLLTFHEAYARGVRPDAALSAAVRAHLADATRKPDVFYWAPFFLVELGRRSYAGDPS